MVYSVLRSVRHTADAGGDLPRRGGSAVAACAKNGHVAAVGVHHEDKAGVIAEKNIRNKFTLVVDVKTEHRFVCLSVLRNADLNNLLCKAAAQGRRH